jgi:hypothetical protein
MTVNRNLPFDAPIHVWRPIRGESAPLRLSIVGLTIRSRRRHDLEVASTIRWVAAQAKALGAVMVTANDDEFRRVAGLAVKPAVVGRRARMTVIRQSHQPFAGSVQRTAYRPIIFVRDKRIV